MADTELLRAELFSIEQLKRHAIKLAALHRIELQPGPDRLLARLADNECVLLAAYQVVTTAAIPGHRLIAAESWLLDNFYLIEQQILQARRHLPHGYSRQLPRLAAGSSADYPRIYDLALNLISHMDGRVDAENASQLVAAYQTVQPLKLGELWAFPIMLQLALLENLRRVALRIANRRQERDAAIVWADRMLTAAEKEPKQLIQLLAEFASADIPLTAPFVEEFYERLQAQGSVMSFVQSWVEQKLLEQDVTATHLSEVAGRTAAANQISMANSIGSLRFIGSMDWPKYVESLSVVEQVLRQDPAAMYEAQDFATRDRYRHVIEQVARAGYCSEIKVAQQAITLAQAAAGLAGSAERTAHVGYYLVDAGRLQLERMLGCRLSWSLCLRRACQPWRLSVYLLPILLITAALTALLGMRVATAEFGVWPGAWTGISNDAWTWQALSVFLLAIPAIVVSSALATALVNLLAIQILPPRALPRLDFSKGIPAQHRTIVIVPTLIKRADDIDRLLEALEIRYLGNRDANLFFALLTDFDDAAQQTLPEDAALIAYARSSVQLLNQKYQDDRPSIFYLLHRPRRWNPYEQVWMGYERKRGKLQQFNALLRQTSHTPPLAASSTQSAFSECVGDLTLLPTIQYVITLDTDTQLPRDSARTLVGNMAHPLNRPRYDALQGRIVEGYTILQPRASISLNSAGRSSFSLCYAGESGIDPYTREVSDVYQDVFSEGSFIGKGIYDVDAFRLVLDGRLPDNLVLSHDLLESGYARSALVTDVDLIEEYPSTYLVDISRRHRWIRGDWQLAGWLMPRALMPKLLIPRVSNSHLSPTVPSQPIPSQVLPEQANDTQHRIANPLSPLSMWKIFDNLRRSLVAPSMLLLLLAGMLAGKGIGNAILMLVLAVLLMPPLISVLIATVSKPAERDWLLHLNMSVKSAHHPCMLALLSLVFLPYESAIHIDAIVRSGLRIAFTRRGLLLWQLPSYAKRNARLTLSEFIQEMWIAPLLAVAGLWLLTYTLSSAWGYLTVLLCWLVSPAVAWWISKPLLAAPTALSHDQQAFLRGAARRTWAYFAQFVSAQDHHLPPDNVQEAPFAAIAMRTSPTNMGMSLLSNLAAHDFGYISTGELLHLTDRTLASMEKLERYRGHFYNWYDTRSLEPLRPHYVSSVDSGNLAGSLLTLQVGLAELEHADIVHPQLFQGLHDTLQVLAEQVPQSDASDLAAKISFLQSTLAVLLPDRSMLKTTQATVPAASPAAYQAPARLEAIGMLEEIAHQGRLLATWLPDSMDVTIDLHADEVSPATLNPGNLNTGNLNAGELNAGELNPSELMYWLHAFNQQALSMLQDLRLFYVADASSDSAAKPTASLHGLAMQQDSAMAHRETNTMSACRQAAVDRLACIHNLVARCQALAVMDYEFLYDTSRDLLSIGYDVGERRRDPSCYDLLASEARLASFILIAQGQLPQKHWFSLGRLLTSHGGDISLISWSGSMFEYLMPRLIMPSFDNTLLDETCKAVVSRQIEYGRQRAVPWGISESCYNTTDISHVYQYRAFGVPGLGFKRGLGDDLVIAPYASALALMVMPRAACRNLQLMADKGFLGRFGFYEAIDFTPSRLPPGKSCVIVRSFMAHHQGMSLLAFGHVLFEQPMQRRFMSLPMILATELLLQERVPKQGATLNPHAAEVSAAARPAVADEGAVMRVFANPNTAQPEVHLLSNGHYHVMATNAGSGYSRWRDLAVTRWREDASADQWGSFIYLRDGDTGQFWSSAHQPTLRKADFYEAVFVQARAEYRRRDQAIETHTEISVSPEDDVEIRRITLTNLSSRKRLIEVTSYAEVVLAPLNADLAHRAFSNLFVQTEILADRQAILCTRRPRTPTEQAPWMFHLLAAPGVMAGANNDAVSYETDRARFIGRCRTAANPLALDEAHSDAHLSNSDGSVLDPIVAIRRRIRLPADASATLQIISGVADTREAALALVDKYCDKHFVERAFEMAWFQSQEVLRHINASEAEAQVYGSLASSIIFASPLRRAAADILKRNQLGQSVLWRFGISGDLPIVLLRIADIQRIDLVKQILQAHSYWRKKGLSADLVILNEDFSGYRALLHDQIMGLINAGSEVHILDKPGGVFVRRTEELSEDDRVLLQTVARIVLSDKDQTLLGRPEQTERRVSPERLPDTLSFRQELLQHWKSKAEDEVLISSIDQAINQHPRIFCNGLGGFSTDGREYIIVLAAGQTTPAPWVNVLASPHIGTVVSETGGAYTWVQNAHEFRLTTWHNDPVSDSSGEALYIRDEQTGNVWSPTPLPAAGTGEYVCRHGFGYSVFEHIEAGIASELTSYVAMDAPVKFVVIKLRNHSGRSRTLSVSAYWELVMGEWRHSNMMHIVTEIDIASGAFLARNAYGRECANRLLFAHVSEEQSSHTGSRTEFIGRNGSLAKPAAMQRKRLSGRTGAGLDPCAALQTQISLSPGQEHEIVFVLGAAHTADEAQHIIQRYGRPAGARQALEAVWEHWSRTLGTVQLETPDAALNVMSNGWLLYQTLSSRMWGRSGYYQSGGAYGFRDQLQDSMALIHAAPWLAREQLMRCAERQFVEGDVQHWWHPPLGQGVRTHFSDDYLWLVYATCHYVRSTGDTGVLDESVHFLEGRLLTAEEEAYYDQPQRSQQAASLYEHCWRAIQYGMRLGQHQLPLMGCGDWNDGMNLVGRDGKGESVWLAWFLYDNLQQFAELAGSQEDTALATQCTQYAASLRTNIEAQAWDGGWYRRAYFDDGTPLGSASNQECQIDSISQSWAVISKGGDIERARVAMAAVDARLVKRQAQLIQLLDPPFDSAALEPGYIKGYVPGVRENGGQYTHAAIWVTMAFAMMGDSAKAWELYAMLNPIHHSSKAESMHLYKVEPYVMSADIYGAAPHTGRGGWTWYTGAAGWMYRLTTETLLGLYLEVDQLRISPCMPAHWPHYQIHYRYHDTLYHITVLAATADSHVSEHKAQPDHTIALVNDFEEHYVTIRVAR